jgi:hypothetical protein
MTSIELLIILKNHYLVGIIQRELNPEGNKGVAHRKTTLKRQHRRFEWPIING